MPLGSGKLASGVGGVSWMPPAAGSVEAYGVEVFDGLAIDADGVISAAVVDLDHGGLTAAAPEVEGEE